MIGWLGVTPPGAVAQATSWLVYHLDAEYGTNSIISSTLTRNDRCRLAELVLASLQDGAPVPELPPDYRPSKTPPPAGRTPYPRIDAGRPPDGTTMHFQPAHQREREAMADWLAEKPSRWYVPGEGSLWDLAPSRPWPKRTEHPHPSRHVSIAQPQRPQHRLADDPQPGRRG